MPYRKLSLFIYFFIVFHYHGNAQTPPGAAYKCSVLARLAKDSASQASLTSIRYYDTSARLIAEIHEGNDHPQGWREKGHIDTLYSDGREIPHRSYRPHDEYIYEGKQLSVSTLYFNENAYRQTKHTYRTDGQIESQTERQVEKGQTTETILHSMVYNTDGKKIQEVLIENATDTIGIFNYFYQPEEKNKKRERNVPFAGDMKEVDIFITLDNKGNPVKQRIVLQGLYEFEKLMTYNDRDQLLTEQNKEGSEVKTSRHFIYDAQGQLIRQVHTEGKKQRKVFTFSNRLPQRDEYWIGEELISITGYEYEIINANY